MYQIYQELYIHITLIKKLNMFSNILIVMVKFHIMQKLRSLLAFVSVS